jgi:hypothetical protein
MKPDNKLRSKIITTLQNMDEVDIFRLIAKKHSISELAEIFGVTVVPIYSFCKKHEVEYVVGESDDQYAARKGKTIEREPAAILFTCTCCKVKKPVDLQSKTGICTKCELNNRRNRV